MAYRFRRGESVGAGARRIIREVIDRTLRTLVSTEMPVPERTHEARKSVKRLRALLRLVHPQLASPADYKTVDHSLKEAAKLLAGVRDRDVLHATLEEVASDALEGEIRKEEGTKGHVRMDGATTDRQRAFADVMKSFSALRAKVSDLQFKKSRPADLVAGYVDTYRQSRRRMPKALAKKSDAELHRWRKLVKYHSYHARLLANVGAGTLKKRGAECQALEEVLGKHHDLALLQDYLNSAKTKKIAGVPVRKLKQRVKKSQAGIEKEVEKRGHRLFCEKPRRAGRDLSL